MHICTAKECHPAAVRCQQLVPVQWLVCWTAGPGVLSSIPCRSYSSSELLRNCWSCTYIHTCSMYAYTCGNTYTYKYMQCTIVHIPVFTRFNSPWDVTVVSIEVAFGWLHPGLYQLLYCIELSADYISLAVADDDLPAAVFIFNLFTRRGCVFQLYLHNMYRKVHVQRFLPSLDDWLIMHLICMTLCIKMFTRLLTVILINNNDK